MRQRKMMKVLALAMVNVALCVTLVNGAVWVFNFPTDNDIISNGPTTATGTCDENVVVVVKVFKGANLVAQIIQAAYGGGFYISGITPSGGTGWETCTYYDFKLYNYDDQGAVLDTSYNVRFGTGNPPSCQ